MPRKEEYAMRKAKGLCTGCGGKRMGTYVKCARCRRLSNEHYRGDGIESNSIRRQVLNHYGKRCVKCGESDFDVLQLDHIDNNGAEHRRTLGISAKSILYWIIRNKFPKGFQVLCANCHVRKTINNKIASK